MIGIGLKGENRASRRSSTKIHLSGPKNPNEQIIGDVSRIGRVIALGSASVAAQAVLPATSWAYGDADELLRKKKNAGKPKNEEIVVSETDLGIKYRVSKKGAGPIPTLAILYYFPTPHYSLMAQYLIPQKVRARSL